MNQFLERGEVTAQLFKNPGSAYRATPFWAWNGKLEKEVLIRQIGYMKEMGFGGFHMHVRVGLETPYLEETFMERVKDCVACAREEDMLAWLYDEDKWPSGFAGGLVTKEERYRARYLLFTPVPYGACENGGSTDDSGAQAKRSGNGRLLYCYDVELGEDGTLTRYARIEADAPARGVKWYAYLETPTPNPWYNNQTYVNTLDKAAIQRFVAVTHEAYKRAVGEAFSTTIPAIFTDEPQFSHKTTLGFAQEQADITLPWTEDLPETFFAAYGEDLTRTLPELVWELPDAHISRVRYHYHDHVCERFATAFADTCGDWCAENGIMLTGHMMEESTLASQTKALGEAMRSYRAFSLPGIDMLCNLYEYTTAKQAQSAAHQYGRVGTLSELYGVTNWDFDLRGHKLQGDWQAALGVAVRVPHLSWMSMAGEAKRDYPASIFYQSPWYRKYKLIEDHFARVNVAMTRGKPVVRVGVIHPIESYWLHFGTREQTGALRAQLDRHFQEITEWLLFGTMDFDFICESLLPEQCTQDGAPLCVGEMRYDVVVVPGCETLRATTLKRLEAFSRAGGQLIVLGELPRLMDAAPAAQILQMLTGAQVLPFEPCALLDALEPVREITIREKNGNRTDNLLTQLRQDGEGRWLFIAQGRKPLDRDVAHRQDISIRIKDLWMAACYDTSTGEIRPVAIKQHGTDTWIDTSLWQQDSLLLHLTPVRTSQIVQTVPLDCAERQPEAIPIPAMVHGTLCEPNSLLLDCAEFALDNEAYEPCEELLRADNVLRRRLGWPLRQDAVAQPWTIPDEAPEHRIRLRFLVRSALKVDGARLALEGAADAQITLNGTGVPIALDGWFVDTCIQTVPLPRLQEGENVLEVSLPFGRRTNVEWCYLIGTFGVRLIGQESTLQPLPNNFGFGDLTPQGLPFYGGSITYRVPFHCAPGTVQIHIPQYRGALIGVALDGQEYGDLLLSPYTLKIPGVSEGQHEFGLTLYGNRHNAFGALHNADPEWTWFGPAAYRTQGDAWCYEYRLRPFGILTSPVITWTPAS